VNGAAVFEVEGLTKTERSIYRLKCEQEGLAFIFPVENSSAAWLKLWL